MTLLHQLTGDWLAKCGIPLIRLDNATLSINDEQEQVALVEKIKSQLPFSI